MDVIRATNHVRGRCYHYAIVTGIEAASKTYTMAVDHVCLIEVPELFQDVTPPINVTIPSTS